MGQEGHSLTQERGSPTTDDTSCRNCTGSPRGSAHSRQEKRRLRAIWPARCSASPGHLPVPHRGPGETPALSILLPRKRGLECLRNLLKAIQLVRASDEPGAPALSPDHGPGAPGRASWWGNSGQIKGPETHSPCFLKIPFLFQIYSKKCIFQDEHTCMAACWKVICNRTKVKRLQVQDDTHATRRVS